MIVKLLTEQHLEFLRLKGGSRGSSESTHVKTPHCWKSHALAQVIFLLGLYTQFRIPLHTESSRAVSQMVKRFLSETLGNG